LPHAIAYNETATRAQLVPVRETLGGNSASGALAEFIWRVGAPPSLKELGLLESDLDRIANSLQSELFWNPESITPAGVRRVLQKAWEGLPLSD
jgi:maleylacetate reductase